MTCLWQRPLRYVVTHPSMVTLIDIVSGFVPRALWEPIWIVRPLTNGIVNLGVYEHEGLVGDSTTPQSARRVASTIQERLVGDSTTPPSARRVASTIQERLQRFYPPGLNV